MDAAGHVRENTSFRSMYCRACIGVQQEGPGVLRLPFGPLLNLMLLKPESAGLGKDKDRYGHRTQMGTEESVS